MRWIAVAGVCVIAVAPALAGGGKDPRQLVLAPADLPMGARPVAKQTGAAPALGWIRTPARALFSSSSHYQAAYRLPTKDVYSAAFVFASEAVARTAFMRLSLSLDDVHRHVKLAPLGDAQVTTYVVADGLEHRFIVRRRSVVWQLDVVDWNAVSRARSRAAALAFARRQQARVG